MSQLVDLATVGLFPTLKDFSVDALKWTDLEEGVVYHIVSTKVVHTQHGQAVVLSLHTRISNRRFSFVHYTRKCQGISTCPWKPRLATEGEKL